MRDRVQLALGTAQLGMRYGALNRSGQPSAEEAYEILDVARDAGLGFVDTAQVYGDSESLIGSWNGTLPVVTKLAPGGVVADSVARLGAPPAVVLLHDFTAVDRWDELRAARADGQTGSIGVSVYTPDEFAAALELDGIGWIQAPCNAFDRRLAERGLLLQAADAGVKVMLRSVFLQGLLLTDVVPVALAHAAPAVAAWNEFCDRIGAGREVAAISYVREVAPDAVVVIGCETAAQLRVNVDCWDAARVVLPLDELPVADEVTIDPRRWAS